MGRSLGLVQLDPQQKFTQPPPRYNEASLVKVLEERGIGRPSTYASIINTIQDRDYVKKIQGRFVPTEIGTVVTGLLVKNFPYIFDTQYTAKLETELDAVEDGEERWTDLLNGFYDHFEKELIVAGREHGRHQAHGARHRRDLRQVRQSADSEVGQVRQLLLLLELHQGEAGHGARRPLEEGSEGGHQRRSRRPCHFPHDGQRHDRGRHRVL